MSKQTNSLLPSVNPDQVATSPYKPGERTIAEIISDLSKPLPKRHLATKTIKGTQLTFIPWYKAVRIMDYFAPGWSGAVVSVTTTPQGSPVERVFVVYRITIPTSDGPISREATGTETLDTDAYGDPSSNSEAQAFKRACAKFGMGLYLYSKEG